MKQKSILLLLFIFLSIQNFCRAQQEEMTEKELARFAIGKMKESLQTLETLEVKFCGISNSRKDVLPNMDYLRDASYGQMISDLKAPITMDHPLLESVVNRCLYRQTPQRHYFELHQKIYSSTSIRYTRDVVYSADFEQGISKRYDISSGGHFTGHESINKLENYLGDRMIYSDPGVLFSHHYGQDAEGKYAMALWSDFFDEHKENATAVEKENEIILTFNYFHEKFEAAICEKFLISTDNYLPLLIESKSTHPRGHQETRFVVEKYFEKNGAWYPERGQTTFFNNGELLSVEYFIVDSESARLNVPLSDEETTIEFMQE